MSEYGYKVQIRQFEGPLDLLLHLVGRACIRIEDIFVSEVTGQYLEYLAQMQYLSMDTASEFIEMAAMLLYIKSRMVLPFDDDEEMEEPDPEQELISRLKTYQMFKDAAGVLSQKEKGALCVYYKLPEEIEFTGERFVFEDLSVHDLIDAYLEILNRLPDGRSERAEEVEIQQDTYTVKDRTKFILQKLNRINSATFFSLFADTRSKSEVAVTFIALLELINKSFVTIRQADFYTDIYITKVSEGA